VLLACSAGIAGYAWHVAQRSRAAAAVAPGAVPALVSPTLARPYLLFRSTALGQTHGRIALHALDAPDGERWVSGLRCERVHFAGTRGICLEARRGALTRYHAHVFDARFTPLASYPLAGPPSRARMSPDGRWAAFTVFVSGHSYSTPGFTTRTSIVDARDGRAVVDDLETLKVLRDGRPFAAIDFNFWGVSFARDGRRFYATLGTGGRTWLVEGDLAAREMRLLQEAVECPSLSPDGTRIAFKQRQPGMRIAWRPAVLDLATRQVSLLPEARSIDDQVEWLDEREIVYALPDDAPAGGGATTSLWALRTDGSAPPRRLLASAASPAVVR
jgi:hypothetical protein